MNPSARNLEIGVPQRRALCIRDGGGTVVRVVQGCVWLTQAADPDDVVLQAGDRFELTRPGVAIAYAGAGARLSVSCLPEGSGCYLAPGDGYRHYAGSIGRTMLVQARQWLRGLLAGRRAGRAPHAAARAQA